MARARQHFSRSLRQGFMASSRLAALRSESASAHAALSEQGKLYRDVLRSIKGLDETTAAGVREAAREQFADHARDGR